MQQTGMQTKVLGATGLHVSRFCLGTVMLGKAGNPDHEDGVRIIHRAIDAGINFIDTADAYNEGESEEIVGKAIKGKRDSFVVASKFCLPSSTDINAQGGSRKWIMRAVEGSLKRLGTDHIDLYQMHRYDEHTDVEEILFTLTDLVRQGKIGYFGSSMYSADRLVESHWTAEKRGLMRFRCEQPNYSIFCRDIERFVLPACHRYGMGVITWGALDSGFLSGKYKSTDDLASNNRIANYEAYAQGSFDPEQAAYRHKIELVHKLTKLADDAGITLAQLAMAFTLEHPYITAPIIGPRTMEQLEGLLPAADMRLDEAVLDAIDQLVPPGTNADPRIHPRKEIPNGTAIRRSR